jgi:hypothetical protein
MNYKEFSSSLMSNPIRIEKVELTVNKYTGLGNDALFQLPFIAMVVLSMSKNKMKPKTTELGGLVGECIEGSMPAYKKSQQHISWSANLRLRTINALRFLELSNLVEVQKSNSRISVTKSGLKMINNVLKGDDDLANNLNRIKRQYRNIIKENRLELVLN